MKRNSFIKLGLLLVFLFITFFSKTVYAANFRYSDFNEEKWNQLLKDNKNFWTSQCDENDEDCVDKVLQNKKRFYIRLYDLLAKAENKVGYINDNYIIVTVFYGLTPDSFNDPGITEDYDPYNLDDDSNSETKDKYIGDIEGEQDAALQYFNEERDSLKELVNSFIGYDSKCYGETSNEVKHNDSGDYCDDNLQVLNGKCYKLLDSYKGTFWDSVKLPFLKTENDKKCDSKSKESGYTNSKLVSSGEKTINVDYFWEYLKTSTYFDRKEHLKPFFKYVLDKTGFKSMKELEKEENKEIYNKNLEYIVDARENIIDNIKSIIEAYGENFNNLAYANNSSCSSSYWWPIGSTETTTLNGVIMATGNPELVNVSSNFGLRTHPVTGKESSKHNGIDIGGNNGATNVISSMDGVVYSVVNGCVEGDKTCGGGYGNHIIIEHSNGNYTLYAHLYNDSATVKQGDKVLQGQVIAKVGHTGSSTAPHLHFEVRVGGADGNSAQDPLTFVNTDEPRKSAGTCDSIASDGATWLAILEGGKRSGDNYVVQNIGDGMMTFGPGITVSNNRDLISKHGIDPSTLNYGSLIPVSVGNLIFADVLQKHSDAVKAILSKNGISLNENQVTALVSLKYNCGNIDGFINNYNTYGSSEQLCSNWWNKKALHDANGKYYAGLAKRRVAECNLFVNGVYNNPYS